MAAILAVDVAGYSRLMGEDEEGPLAALRAVRRELADPKIAEHRGRIVKTTGDGLLVEFVWDRGPLARMRAGRPRSSPRRCRSPTSHRSRSYPFKT